jgi:dTDP-D-glucose 4,6-dehydratase
MRSTEQKGIMRSKDSTIFVTGGAGFIGSAVVRHLLRHTHARVVNIDKLTYAASLESLSGAAGNPHYSFEKQCSGYYKLLKYNNYSLISNSDRCSG